MEPTTKPKGYELPDLREKAVNHKGETQISEKRLYLQLQVYTGCSDPKPLADALQASGIESVLYLDVNDPRGVALLALSEDPALFAGAFRDLQNHPPFAGLTRRPELTMVGRTYATGREPNLEFMLLKKPRQTVFNPDWPWAVWYPLRRKPNFAILDPADQGKILYDLAHDIRLACHGLDAHDNEFVIGLIGKDLTPLSQCVQEMRKTQQTAKYIKKLGPFFVGKVYWQAGAPK
jgi:hypothetical protein